MADVARQREYACSMSVESTSCGQSSKLLWNSHLSGSVKYDKVGEIKLYNKIYWLSGEVCFH